MTDTVKIEYYVRFESEKYGSGIFEAPAPSLEEAAGQFVEDTDSVSAMKMSFDAKGRITAAEDVTDAVINHLKELIDDDTYTACPHPFVEDHFNEWEELCEREAQDQAEHERAERSMLHTL
jgi:hypothetical protein